MLEPTEDPLVAASRAQDGVLSRAQLRSLGITYSRERAEVVARRWRRPGPYAVLLHNGSPTRLQRCWVAVIDAGPAAALCAFTALELDGLTGWAREAVEVLVPRGNEIRPVAGVRVHESRRYDPVRDVHPSKVPPRTRTARSAVDAATWSRHPRTAVGVLAAVVQQGLATPDALGAELESAGRVRHRRLLAGAVADIAGGAHALSEIDFARLCRRFHLPAPVRQAVRCERSGRRRYLDAEWETPSGGRLVAEVDGALHLLPRTYWDDQDRANELVLDGYRVLRFPAYVVRHDPERVAAQLSRALGVAMRSRLSG